MPASTACPRIRRLAVRPVSTIRRCSPTAWAGPSDAKAEAALTFARALVEHTGQVSKAEFDAVRAAGHSDAEIIEIITHVAMNIFTNLLGKATQVEIDFPKIELNKAA